MIGELEHPVDVMLDQQHRQIGRDALDDRANAFALGGGKPRQRFVEQQHTRRGGQRNAHVQQPLATVGQRARIGLLDARKAKIADDLVGLAIDRCDGQRIGERIEPARMARLHGEADILADTQFGKQIGDLERAADARLGNLFGRMTCDRLAHQRGFTFIRREHAGQEIECRCLACAVRADQRMQRAVGDGDIDPLHGLDAAEALHHVASGQHRPLDGGFRPQEFRQRQRLDLARRHRRVFSHFLAERREQFLAHANQSGRREHDEADEHKAEPQQPVLGVDAEKLSEQNEEQRAERRPEKTAHAADHNHRQQLAGERHRNRIGRGHAVLVQQKDTGEPG